MRTLTYFFIGILFGITLFKSEAASWFRIYEMFQFKSFHMYGIIGSALVLGVIITQSIKRFKLKSFYGNTIVIGDKPKLLKSNLYGGIVFGLGWALVGACPGPIFVLSGRRVYTCFSTIVFCYPRHFCLWQTQKTTASLKSERSSF